MVARTSQSARLKLAVAAGGGTLLVFLAVVGGVVGWFSSSNSDQIQHPEVIINLAVTATASHYILSLRVSCGRDRRWQRM